MDHERRVFLQLIQDELPSLTLRELGEILTSPAARSVSALPVSSLLTGVAPSNPAPVAKSRRPSARAAVGEKSAESNGAAPGPRLRPVPAATPRSPISARSVEDAEELDVGGHTPVANSPHSPADHSPLEHSLTAAAHRPPAPLQLEIPPASDRSNVDVIRSAVSRTLAQHNRFDSDTLVLNALRSTGEWIRARDLRPRVGLQPDDLRAVLNRLVKLGAVRREGEGPDTVYQVVPPPAAAGN